MIEFKGRAISQGVSKDTVDYALKNAKFLERIIALDRKQPEFFEKTYEYLDKRVNEVRIQAAKKLINENSVLLQKVNAKFKVDKEILVALWGIETNFGVNKGKVDIISALSTLSFDNRRSEYFEKELIILLKLIDKKIIKYESLYGSWAGAIGNFQFMPSTIQNYALNFDETSDIDLINSFQDSLASAANYLKTIGNHDFTVLAGYENFYSKSESMGASRDQYLFDTYPFLNQGPAALRDNFGTAFETAYRSYFGRATYSYKDKYLVQANIRRDGSSRFNEDYRWGVFHRYQRVGWLVRSHS